MHSRNYSLGASWTLVLISGRLMILSEVLSLTAFARFWEGEPPVKPRHRSGSGGASPSRSRKAIESVDGRDQFESRKKGNECE